MWRVFVVVALVGTLAGCQKTTNPRPATVAVADWSFELVKTHPHTRVDYTQGLTIRNGVILESTGRYGQSKIRRVNLEDGVSLKKRNLDPKVFGEGLTEFEGRIYQLTWRAGDCIVYDLDSLDPVDHFKYTGEGWGLTHDGTHLIMSDGSFRLTYRDPKTFETVKKVPIFRSGRPQVNLNELEFVDGLIFANIYESNDIIAIDPAREAVVGVIDCTPWTERAKRLYRGSEVLNGIAFDAATGHYHITGKNWPVRYQMKLTKP